MKNTFVTGLLLISLLAGCQNPIPSPTGESNLKATLSLSVADSSRTVLPGTTTPASYRLFGNGPSGATVGTLSSTTGSFSIPDLAYGSWTFTVGGWDSVTGGNEFLTGSTTINIASPTATASIALGAVVGANTPSTLVLNLDWTASARSIDSITGTLTPLGGGADIAISALTISGMTATKTITNIPSGSYVIKLTSKLGATVVANTKMETVLFYRFQTTTWNATLQGTEFKSSAKDIATFNFLATNNATLSANGNVDVNTTVSSTAFTVTLPAGASTASLTPNITVSAGATVSPASGTSQVFLSPVTYTVTAADGSTNTYTVTVNVAPSPALTAFSIGSATGDISGNTIAVKVSAASDLTSLTPTFTTSSGAIVRKDSTGGVIQTSGSTANNFTSSVNYVVTDNFGSTAKTYTVTVSFVNQMIFFAIGNDYYSYTLAPNGTTASASTTNVAGPPLFPIVADPTGAFSFALVGTGTNSLKTSVINRTNLTVGSPYFSTINSVARPPQFDRTGKYLYIINSTDNDANKLDYYQLDRSKGLIGGNLGGTFQVNNYLTDFRMFSKSDFAVTARSNTNKVQLWTIASNGSWSVVLPEVFPEALQKDAVNYPTEGKTEALYLSPDETRVFAISGVESDGSSIKLSSWTLSSGALGNGKRLIVTNPLGALAFTGPSSSFPNKFAVHPSGKFAYVLVTAGEKILRVNIDNDGTMTQQAASDVSTQSGHAPVSMVFNKTGTMAYVSNPNNNWVEYYSINTTTGALTYDNFLNMGYHATLDRSGNYIIAFGTGSGSYYLNVFNIQPGTAGLHSVRNSAPDVGTTQPSNLSVYEVYP